MVTIVQGNVDNFDRNKLEIANVSEYWVGSRSSTGTYLNSGCHTVIIPKLNGFVSFVYLRS